MVFTLWKVNIDPENTIFFFVETCHIEPLSARVNMLIYWRVTHVRRTRCPPTVRHGHLAMASQYLWSQHLGKASLLMVSY